MTASISWMARNLPKHGYAYCNDFVHKLLNTDIIFGKQRKIRQQKQVSYSFFIIARCRTLPKSALL